MFTFSSLKPNSLKMECDKLAQEKTEMQRHYVMVSKDTVCVLFYVSMSPLCFVVKAL